MGVHEKYAEMMKEVHRIKDLRADPNTKIPVGSTIYSDKVLFSSKNKHNRIKIHRFTLGSGM